MVLRPAGHSWLKTTSIYVELARKVMDRLALNEPLPEAQNRVALLGNACRCIDKTKNVGAAGPGEALDWLGRSLTNLIELMTLLAERGVGFKSLSEAISRATLYRAIKAHRTKTNP